MKVFTGEQVLLRIFISEADKYGHRPLYQALVEEFRHAGLAGATVLKGVMGFGAKSHLHTTHMLRLSQDLPMVVEAVDTKEAIDGVLPLIEELLTEGLVTMETVQVLRYGSQ